MGLRPYENRGVVFPRHTPLLGDRNGRGRFFVGKIEKDPVGMFSNAHADRSLGIIKLCTRFKEIER